MRNKYLAIILAVLRGLIFSPSNARAHCDTLDGPVIQDARMALEKGEVTPVLKWVKQESEPQIRAAFEKALAGRKPKAEGADMEFFETLVRVHRAGEGADFTGLKPVGEVEPIVAQADKALATGSVDDLTSQMSQHLSVGVRERFERVLEVQKHKDESVEAGREYVEAYVSYVHYVEGLHEKIAGKGSHEHKQVQEPEHKE